MMQLYSQKSMESQFWNEYLETMPREKLDQLHLRRIRGLIKYAYDRVPMYQDLYDKAGVKPEDIRTLDDFIERIPTIDKTNVVVYQSKRPPFGDSIVQDSEDYITFFFQTSGTTGKPMIEVGYYKEAASAEWAHMWWAHGIRPRDIFYFAFPFGTFMAFWAAYHNALVMGGQVITSGGLDSKARIRQIIELKPTVLVATPTYALRLAEVAREMGVDARETSIRYVSSAGVPGAVVSTIRQAIEGAWGAKAIDLYGVSDVWGSDSWHCPAHVDRLHLTEATAYGVVLDERGHLVPDGGQGELVLTNYHGSLMPSIKYRTHDVVEWHKEKCDCGRTWLWLREGVLGRTDNMVTIKGTNVYPTAIQGILGEIPGLSQNVEIYISRKQSEDEVKVLVEPKEEMAPTEYDGLRTRAQEELRYRIGVGIEVEMVCPKSLPRYEVKAKRVFDHRKG